MVQSSSELTDSVRHEFGHLVVAKLLGFATGGISLSLDRACAEIILTPSFKSLTDVAEYGRRRTQVLYAGAGAQALSGGVIDPGRAELLLKTTSANDHAKIRELLRIVSAVEHPDVTGGIERGRVTTAIDNELRSKAGELVEKHSALIVDLTTLFVSRMGIDKQTFTLPAGDIDRLPGIIDLR